MKQTRSIRLGAGAGFAGDRLDPARELAMSGELDYLIFECLGERTVAAGQSRKLRDPAAGYDPLLLARMRAVLPHTLASKTTVVTNSGAANPLGASKRIAQLIPEIFQGRPVRIATVTGDDVLEAVKATDPVVWETGRPVSQHTEPLVSANAYIGAEAVTPALAQDTDIIIAGRLADPSLYLAPLMYEFGWENGDHDLLGAGTVVGHLLECAGQLTGGYYADPVTKPVPNMDRLGFPFADVNNDGTAVFGKLEDSGGILTTRTCSEQLLYEVGNPAAYLTPDVTADFSAVNFKQVAPERVTASGGRGSRRPEQLKVTLGYRGGWSGEGQITYAGPRAFERADLAGTIVKKRLTDIHGIPTEDIHVEFIGAGAAFRGLDLDKNAREVRLRVTAQVGTEEEAEIVGWEVESLYTNGPAGGGGARKSHSEILSIRSCLIPRDLVPTEVHMTEVK